MHLLWFSYRVVVKTMSRTSVPNSSLSTPRDEPPPIIIYIYGDEYTYSLRQYKDKTECVFVSLFVFLFCFCFVLFLFCFVFCFCFVFLWGEVISQKQIFKCVKIRLIWRFQHKTNSKSIWVLWVSLKFSLSTHQKKNDTRATTAQVTECSHILWWGWVSKLALLTSNLTPPPKKKRQVKFIWSPFFKRLHFLTPLVRYMDYFSRHS